MAKFKVGDKVTWSGHDGKEPGNYVVDEIRGNGYAIGEQGLPGWVAVVKEEKLKPGWISRNGVSMDEEYDSARARNAKFKVGDKVTDGNAVYVITDVDDGIYEWKVVSGKADPSHSEGGEIAWAEGKMRLANSACNAKFRLGDRVEFRGVKGTVKRVVEGRDGMPTSYKIKGDDGEVYTPSEWDVKYVGNSAPLASTNAVVQNAINARRARNASSDVMVKAWEDFVEDAGRFIRSTSLSRLVGLAAKTPDDEAGKRVRDAIDAATSEISAVTDKIQNIIRKYGSRI